MKHALKVIAIAATILVPSIALSDEVTTLHDEKGNTITVVTHNDGTTTSCVNGGDCTLHGSGTHREHVIDEKQHSHAHVTGHCRGCNDPN